jgi:ubiquinone/menaquinone biosynthesis C-methylase UbiE
MNQSVNHQRKPESGQTYFGDTGVNAYTRNAHKGILILWEKKFVNSILSTAEPSQAVRVLDMGTGPGWIPVRLAQQRPAWEITGLDFSKRMLDQARNLAEKKNVNVNWVEADVLNTGLPPEHFDLVISHFSLHELPEIPHVLKEVSRLLKPDGRFIAHDLARPPAHRIPVMCVINWLLSFSMEFTRQYADSLRASYTMDEMAQFLASSPLQGRVQSIHGGSQFRIEAVKKDKTNL